MKKWIIVLVLIFTAIYFILPVIQLQIATPTAFLKEFSNVNCRPVITTEKYNNQCGSLEAYQGTCDLCKPKNYCYSFEGNETVDVIECISAEASSGTLNVIVNSSILENPSYKLNLQTIKDKTIDCFELTGSPPGYYRFGCVWTKDRFILIAGSEQKVTTLSTVNSIMLNYP